MRQMAKRAANSLVFAACVVVLLAPIRFRSSGIAAEDAVAYAAVPPAKESGAFLSPELLARAKANIAKYPWAAEVRKQIVQAAQPWMKLTDDELWAMMYGPTISRSWFVWSNGYCPVCHKPVPTYSWVVDAFTHPWKVQCPHCKEFFPKNDFARFYHSGLDERGLFDPRRADRSLLFNTEHPDANDPLHNFCVDDGEGYVADGHRWRFIGDYLVWGQWKQLILAGITRLSAAYAVTDELVYAHKAGVLLDRVADLFPSFDFGQQGVMYEGKGEAGY